MKCSFYIQIIVVDMMSLCPLWAPYLQRHQLDFSKNKFLCLDLAMPLLNHLRNILFIIFIILISLWRKIEVPSLYLPNACALSSLDNFVKVLVPLFLTDGRWVYNMVVMKNFDSLDKAEEKSAHSKNRLQTLKRVFSGVNKYLLTFFETRPWPAFGRRA